jgi:Protein of unknown function (DUF3048) N-terminal domain/Protein of unknown function (DUF3048) C-terminal domain
MSLQPRGKAAIALATVVFLAAGVLGYFILFPQNAPAFVRRTLNTVGLAEAPPPPPPTCPLTGQPAPHGVAPRRPALAVKIENYPDARPQAGLQSADIVYEEQVEGGITRFIAVYQCHDDARVGPVRSARTTDPDVLAQFGVPILAFSGAAPNVVRAVDRANLTPITETTGVGAFSRDPDRESPHNLYAGTKALYRVAGSKRPAPAPVFTYSDEVAGRSRVVSAVHLPFSTTYADVYWAWDRRAGQWVRSHGDVPHTVEGGEQVSATNVVIQVVQMVIGPRGGISPHLTLTGSGKAYVLRDGRMVAGRWQRPTRHDITRFVTKDGEEIALAPGRTWVELLPSSVALETTR